MKHDAICCVVIVNYRTADLVAACLHSIAVANETTRGMRVSIVDNASNDGSVEFIEKTIAENGWSSWMTVLPAKKNLGFSGGNNRGIRSCDARYYWLLNPDTIVRPGALAALVDFLDANPRVGIVGSRLENSDGSPQGSARRCLKPITELVAMARTGLVYRVLRQAPVTLPEHEQPVQCDWVSGAAMVVRREVFDEIGLLDEGYFLYFEELDFCERARAAGWEVWHVPQSRVVHIEGSSTGICEPRTRRIAYWFNSRRRFFLKRYGVSGLITADCYCLLGRTIFSVRQITGVGRRSNTDPKWLTWDILRGDLRSIMTGEAFRIAEEARRTWPRLAS